METPLQLIKKMRETIMKHQQANGFNTVFDFLNEDLEDLEKALAMSDVVKSLPNDKEVKAHIDTLPYYGTCTTEYNEGFEDGVKWLKEKLAK